ncbi:MAG: hypothetical protein JWR39_1382 [Devosia sp.]|nr:hypothetical protein [Devosia sp.]
MPLVLVRTPTYRRPEALKRAVRCLRAQTHEEWICEVRDDCPEGSARAVVEELQEPRLRYVHNRPQKFMVRNLDDCFLRENPYGADYFFMLEDDNQVLPQFMARGRDIIEQNGVSICQINQVIEYADGTAAPYRTEYGIFDDLFDEAVYQPQELHLAMFGAIGVSNGALFWSRRIGNELAIRVDTIPTLEEFLRTWLVAEPIYICREKLAVWASSEQSTTRNLGLSKSWLRRELDLKASITALQREVWRCTTAPMRKAFLEGTVLRTPLDARHKALAKAGIKVPFGPQGMPVAARLKRFAVRHVGREHPSVAACIKRAAGQSTFP